MKMIVQDRDGNESLPRVLSVTAPQFFRDTITQYCNAVLNWNRNECDSFQEQKEWSFHLMEDGRCYNVEIV